MNMPNSAPIARHFKPMHFYLAAFAVAVVLFLSGVSDILFPFVVAIIAAYFLDPAADALERKGMTRRNAVIVITCGFFSPN